MTIFQKSVLRLLVAIYNCVRAENSRYVHLDASYDIYDSSGSKWEL